MSSLGWLFPRPLPIGARRPADGKLAVALKCSELWHRKRMFQALEAMPPTAAEPSARRILLAVTGTSPQVVTETVYALACQRTRAVDAA